MMNNNYKPAKYIWTRSDIFENQIRLYGKTIEQTTKYYRKLPAPPTTQIFK